ncbi:hypothetical protein [Nubsella zeaxanthinifaciens]|jgi:hypothetical protein|uniref:hypothetical protein n=1 Tax=Nubsella zeaxanthinifaciens TaxID=392412 RepID=UPI000DE2600C|nr:hypothetical protein [Nubsella zeaxanthinifaciens]
MNNYTLLLLLCFAFASCSKNEGVTPENIDVKRVVFSTDRIVQKVGKPFKLGIWIENSFYTGEENFSLTVNGIEAKTFKLKDGGEFFIMFDVQAIEKAGDYNAIFTFKKGASSLTVEKKIRVVDDYTLLELWNKLDIAYVKENQFFLLLYKSGSFWFETPMEVMLATNTIKGTQFGVGEYRSVFAGSKSILASNTLVDGLNGSYHVYYQDEKVKEIRVFYGDAYNISEINVEEIFAEMTRLYGQPTLASSSSKLYRIGAFDVEVRYTLPLMQAIIKKVR